MPAYSGLRVAELRELCEERDIDPRGPRGLNKPQLIAALRVSDENNDEGREESENGDGELEIGADTEFCGDSGSVADFVSVAGQATGDEPESVAVSRLKLALAEKQAKWERERDERASAAREREWEIERERLEMQSRVNSNAPPAARTTRPDVHHVLPKMTGNDDVLTFFSHV